MADALVRTIHYGDAEYLYWDAPADTGTATISSGWHYTVYDSLGSAVSDRTSIAGDGQDGAAATPRAWAKLNTAASSGPTVAALARGFYTAIATLTVTGSDSLARTLSPSICFEVI